MQLACRLKQMCYPPVSSVGGQPDVLSIDPDMLVVHSRIAGNGCHVAGQKGSRVPKIIPLQGLSALSTIRRAFTTEETLFERENGSDVRM